MEPGDRSAARPGDAGIRGRLSRPDGAADRLQLHPAGSSRCCTWVNTGGSAPPRSSRCQSSCCRCRPRSATLYGEQCSVSSRTTYTHRAAHRDHIPHPGAWPSLFVRPDQGWMAVLTSDGRPRACWRATPPAGGHPRCRSCWAGYAWWRKARGRYEVAFIAAVAAVINVVIYTAARRLERGPAASNGPGPPGDRR